MEIFGNPISGYTTEFYSELIEKQAMDIENNYTTLRGNKNCLDSKAKLDKVRY